MRFSKLTQIRCNTHNPLLMYQGCNPIPSEIERQLRVGRENPNLKFYNEFHRLYNEALKITASKNLVFGLEADFSDTNCGIGGFSAGGYVPLELFRRECRGDSEQQLLESIKFYWPQCHQTGKYMKFLGSINLGIWPRVLHDSIADNGVSYWEGGRSYAVGLDISKNGYRDVFNSDIWMHLFVSEQSDFETFVPDCHVRLNVVSNYDKMAEHEAEFSRKYDAERQSFTDEKLTEVLTQFQKENCVEPEFICAPKQFFTNLRPRFQWDGIGKQPQKIEKLRDSENPNNFMSWKGGGDCHIYGRPHSQQTERRYRSPDRHNGLRALTPVFAYTDQSQDITHQFYGDMVMGDAIRHKMAYYKLESSNT